MKLHHLQPQEWDPNQDKLNSMYNMSKYALLSCISKKNNNNKRIKQFSQSLKIRNHDHGLSEHNIYFYYENIKF